MTQSPRRVSLVALTLFQSMQEPGGVGWNSWFRSREFLELVDPAREVSSLGKGQE
jgi:hypothetical protein